MIHPATGTLKGSLFGIKKGIIICPYFCVYLICLVFADKERRKPEAAESTEW